MDCLPLPNFGSHRLLLRGYLTHLLDSSFDVILWNDSYRVVMPPPSLRDGPVALPHITGTFTNLYVP